jgi:hypothetical protein
VSKHTHTHARICKYIYVCMRIALFSIPLMESHTQIEQVFRPVIFWDCVQHKVVTTFQRFGITIQSCIQGPKCPSRICLCSIQLAHTCLLEVLTYSAYVVVADFQGRHSLVYFIKGSLQNIFITSHFVPVSCGRKWGI